MIFIIISFPVILLMLIGAGTLIPNGHSFKIINLVFITFWTVMFLSSLVAGVSFYRSTRVQSRNLDNYTRVKLMLACKELFDASQNDEILDRYRKSLADKIDFKNIKQNEAIIAIKEIEDKMNVEIRPRPVPIFEGRYF